jgi:hypothetical protein
LRDREQGINILVLVLLRWPVLRCPPRERKFCHEFNCRLFAEQLLFLDDVQDYVIDALKQPVAAADIIEFFRDRVGELPLS